MRPTPVPARLLLAFGLLVACGGRAERAEQPPELAAAPSASPTAAREDPEPTPQGRVAEPPPPPSPLPASRFDPCSPVEGPVVVVEVRPAAFVVAGRGGSRRVVADASDLDGAIGEAIGSEQPTILVSARIDAEDRTRAARDAAMRRGTARLCNAGADATAGHLGRPRSEVEDSGYSSFRPDGAVRVASVTEDLRRRAGPLAADGLRRTTRRHLREIRWCYEVALQRDPDLEADVEMRWTIDPSGVPRAAPVVSGLDEPTLRECLRRAVLRWDFPRRGGDQPTVVDARLRLRLVDPR